MILKYLDNKDHAVVNTSRCTGCGICTDVCPHQLFIIDGAKAVIKEPERCIGCGACMKNCPFDAVAVKTGVGCAAAVFNSILKRGSKKAGSCSCEIDEDTPSCCSDSKSSCC